MITTLKTAPFESRESFISAVSNRSKVVPKDDFIVELCRGKTVLDIGCIDHSAQTAKALGAKWLHSRIANVAKSVIGLDMLAEDARKLNESGYSITVADAQNFDLNQKFDVIVGGDIIEHLSDVGAFLNSAVKHMRNDSSFVVTTPNAFNVEQMIRIFVANRIAVNYEHTSWLDPLVIWQLVARHGLEITDFRWVDTRFKMGKNYRPFLRKLVEMPLNAIMAARPLWRRDFAIVMRKTQTPIRCVPV